MRVNKEIREALELLKLERIESLYRATGNQDSDKCRDLLMQHLEEQGCIASHVPTL